MTTGIISRYGCGTEDIGYYIEHPKLETVGISTDKVRVVIFENAIGGLGYLKSFSKDLYETEGGILIEMLQNFSEILNHCNEKVNKNLELFSLELQKYVTEVGEKGEEIINIIVKAYESTFPDIGLYPHINSIRRALVNVVEINPEIRSLLDDLLEKGPHCWDGCQLCVMLERGCNFLPFDQPFLVSNRLLRDSIKILQEMLSSPVNLIPLKVGVKKEFDRFLQSARSNVDLISPWLSPEIIAQLIDLHDKRGVSIRIITSNDFENESHLKSLKLLSDVSSRSEISTRVLKLLHAKGMFVDKVMLLYGSFNFTISGLNSNVENLVIDCSSEGAKNFSKEFQKLWEQAMPLKV